MRGFRLATIRPWTIWRRSQHMGHNQGMHKGVQIIPHRQLAEDLLSARDAIRKKTDMSLDRSPIPDDTSTDEGLYKMGFHFDP